MGNREKRLRAFVEQLYHTLVYIAHFNAVFLRKNAACSLAIFKTT
jgi:hypothetical protein